MTFDDIIPTFDREPVGGYRIRCPSCSKGPADKTLGVTVKPDGGVWHCHRCDARGSWKIKQGIRRAKPTPPTQHLTLAANWMAFWHTLLPICGTALAYLVARACAVPPADGHLRCSESLHHPSGYVGPGIVALVTDAITGDPMTLHRTWIKSDGTKADVVNPPRLLLGKHRKDGGVVRLWPDDAVTTGLGIAEGIETALTLGTVFKPVWSLVDAGNMAKFPVLGGIESLLIAADHDAAGERAANECARRWCQADREVRIVRSPVPGEDLNDYARRAA